jgi:hypothetical protein
MKPKHLDKVKVEPISPKVLAMLDASIANLKKGVVFGPIDLSEFRSKRKKKP